MNSSQPPIAEPKLPSSPPSLRDYAAKVTTERLEMMLTHVEGVRQNEEIEPVHQMRVWSRRSRAALETFACCFAGKAFKALEREVKAVTGALGEARDLDVMIETLTKRADALPPEQRPGVEAFIAGLRQRREANQEPVAKAVTRLEQHGLVRRFEEIIGKTAGRDGHG